MGREGWVVKEKLQGSGYNLCGVYRLLQMIGFSCMNINQSTPAAWHLSAVWGHRPSRAQ